MNNQYYVYVHETTSGEVFYVGKGIGDRAWRKGRDLNWNLFVEKNLNHQYNVRIVIDKLTEDKALLEEAKLISKYGEQLVNRQNMNRSLDINKLNTRNEIEVKLKESELNAELADDLDLKADYFLDALKFYKQVSNTIIDNGLVGKLLSERPLGNIRLLDKTIRALVAANRKQQATAVFNQYFIDYPHDKELSNVASILKIIERGEVKLTAQIDFIPPEPLPIGWQYAKERNVKVLRLDHKIYETDKSIKYELNELRELIDKDLSDAMLYVKQWIVSDEKLRRKDPLDNSLWLYSEALKIAKKQKNLQEQCLFQQRFTNLLKGRNKNYEKNLIILRKLSAKLEKQKTT